MSKKSKIFSYGQGKRDLKFSKFDMSFSNTRSSVFGRLDPVAVYETLPADYWNVGSDGVTLLKPLAAPAFTDIKQHHYAYHVRNSAIWKHWNDFITNGTAYSGVYGSNASNQDNDNPWRVPAINAPYLAQICKLGSGWGVPFFTISSSEFNPSHPFFTSSILLFFHISDTPQLSNLDISDFISLYFRSSFVVDYFGQSVSDFLSTHFISAKFLDASHYNLVFAGTGYTETLVRNFLLLSGQAVSDENTNDSVIGDHIATGSTSVDSQYSLFQSFIDVMYFYDDAISECRLNDSPFISSVHYYTDEQSEKVFDFQRRIITRPISRGYTYSSAGFFNGAGRLTDYLSVDSSITGRSFKIHYGSNANLITNFEISNQPYWAIDAKFFGFSDDNSDLTYLDSIASTVFDAVVPWIGMSQNDDRKNVDNTISAFNKIYFARLDSPQYKDSALSKLGYSHTDFAFYLAKNSLQLLESFNIPVAALATRSFFFYRYERFNALPFFAYSKIWDDFYRNTVVSSPELNWSETNGDILVNSTMKSYLNNNNLPQPGVFPEEFATSTDRQNYKLNGWMIPFHASPKNSIGELQHYRDFTSPDSSFKIRQYLENSQHYIRIDDMSFVFHFLTGYDLDSLVISQLYDGITEVPESVNTYSFRNFFIENFYLPNYYNGLLHYKYQNFNKDYFSSAMLDPMSGANQVLQGSTVNDLRVAEAKQSWFEKIAPKRSVEGFMETIFGIKPVLDNCEPTFLGSDHQRINIGEVIQTSSSTDTSPQGQRVGIGGARGGSGLVHGKCNEHGFLIILSSFTVEAQYQTAFEKKWIVKNSYMDYPTIDFANIGNESILMKEVNFDGHAYVSYKNFNKSFYSFTLQQNAKGLVYGHDNAQRVNLFQRGAQPQFHLVRQFAAQSGTSLNNVFGYIPRYSSYKFKFDEVHGDFRETLDFWTTFRKFHSMPILSHDFVNWEYMAQENELKRLFVVTDDTEDEFNVSTHFTASVDRALPYVCVPSSK